MTADQWFVLPSQDTLLMTIQTLVQSQHECLFLLKFVAGGVAVKSCQILVNKVELLKKQKEEVANLKVEVEAMASYAHAQVLEATTDESSKTCFNILSPLIAEISSADKSFILRHPLDGISALYTNKNLGQCVQNRISTGNDSEQARNNEYCEAEKRSFFHSLGGEVCANAEKSNLPNSESSAHPNLLVPPSVLDGNHTLAMPEQDLPHSITTCNQPLPADNLKGEDNIGFSTHLRLAAKHETSLWLYLAKPLTRKWKMAIPQVFLQSAQMCLMKTTTKFKQRRK